MEKLNFINFNQYHSQKPLKSQVLNDNQKQLSTSDYGAYSSAVSAYGKASISFKGVGQEINRLNDLILNTADNEVISLQEAVEEMNGVNTTNKNRSEFILACTYDTDSPELVISKKAIYMMKERVLISGQVPKLINAVRTCMDESDMSFKSDKFDSLFDMRGKVKYSANLKSNPQNYDKNLREIKAKKRMAILDAVENNIPEKVVKTEFKQSEWFVPIAQRRQEMINDLENIDDISDDLKKSLINEFQKDNYDVKETYQKHYACLEDCKTREDVKTLYPELKFVEEQPKYDASGSKLSLHNRLAQADYDRVVVDMFKMGHLQLKPTNTIYVDLENSSPTSYTSLKNAGFTFSMPSKEVLALMKKGEELTNKYKNVPHLETEEIDKLAQKQAIKSSKFWTDYTQLTSKNWMPIRWINNKRSYPDKTRYSTEKLTDVYLLGLYLNHKNRAHEPNPLAKYDDKEYLSRPMINIVNNTYWTVYDEYKTNLNERLNNKDFKEFTKQFDKQAIGKSIEHLEDNYKKTFFRNYWTKEKISNIQNNLQESYDLIYEKILLKEDIKRKTVSEEDVKKLIEEDLNMDSISAIDEKKYSRFKYVISNIENKDLRERCQSCISDPNFVDKDYFDTLYNIIEQSTNPKTEKLDESKAFVLLTLHDEFMTHVLNTESDATEEEFVNARLKKYENSFGGIDYEGFIDDSEKFLRYEKISTALLKKGDDEINYLVADKFITIAEPDYFGATEVLTYYDKMPNMLKARYLNIVKSSQGLEPEELKDTLSAFYNKVSSWNIDKDEVIIMDKHKIPQKVVITTKAKEELWDLLGGNIEKYDSILFKFYSAGTARTGDKKGQGVKELNNRNSAELKIMGDYGNLRMYSRPVTDEDRQKYETDDGINLKFIFDKCGDHL